MGRKNPADTLEEQMAMERRFDGPWTERDLELYRAELQAARKARLWEWHDQPVKKRQVWQEPPGCWVDVDA